MDAGRGQGAEYKRRKWGGVVDVNWGAENVEKEAQNDIDFEMVQLYRLYHLYQKGLG